MTTPELKWCFLGADAARVAGGRAGMQTSAKAVLFSLFLSRSRCLFSFPSSLSLPLIDKDKANLFGNQGHGWCRQTLLLRSPPRSRPPLALFSPPTALCLFRLNCCGRTGEERCEMSALRLCGTSFLSHARIATMH